MTIQVWFEDGKRTKHPLKKSGQKWLKMDKRDRLKGVNANASPSSTCDPIAQNTL